MGFSSLAPVSRPSERRFELTGEPNVTIEGVKEQLEEFNFNPQSIITFDLFIDVSLFFFFFGFVKVRSSLSSHRKNRFFRIIISHFIQPVKGSDSRDLSAD